MRKYFISLFLFIHILGISQAQNLKPGVWRATVPTVLGELPFNLLVQKSDQKIRVFAVNGDEKLELDEPYFLNDSVHINIEVFDAEIIAKIEGNKMHGIYRKKLGNLKPRQGVFTAEYGKNYRFEPYVSTHSIKIKEKYAVVFNPGSEAYQSIGLFKQIGNKVTGTFLTSTGDYRFLEGNVIDDSLKLTCFDGTHIFMFTAKIKNDSLVGGKFCSSLLYTENWSGIADKNASLPDANSLTFLKEGYKTIDFAFKNELGKTVSIKDERYKNKILIIQIMGSWCPNCMDETRFLVQNYAKLKSKGVEIIGLSFEKKIEPEYAYPKIKSLKERFKIPYEVLIAGTNSKTDAAKSLPMLNHIMSFPTMILIGKDSHVEMIHTGFSGPGTGIYYEKFIDEFNTTIKKLSQ